MKYKEAPWWIPLAFMGTALIAVLTIPAATGHGLRHLGHGVATAVQGAFGVDPEKPVTIELPDPATGDYGPQFTGLRQP